MADWYVDKGLGTLIGQMKELFPGIVIGTIAGSAHHKQNPNSDHEPEADGSVDAADFMIGKSFTADDAKWFVNTLVRWKDSRYFYSIYNRKIISSTVSPWTIRDYHGNDPHTNHVHLSVNDEHENDKSDWRLTALRHEYVDLDGYTLPILNEGMNDADFNNPRMIKRVQRLLGVTVDGDYGPETSQAVKVKMDGGNGRTIGLREWVTIYGLTED